mmetsp:Transcript_2907/g.5447  ORF Transcript_2907/g.5447 Transcript_2907/m.5447 type:complete len:591 (+) Transcript_2907:238-2010(+)
MPRSRRKQSKTSDDMQDTQNATVSTENLENKTVNRPRLRLRRRYRNKGRDGTTTASSSNGDSAETSVTVSSENSSQPPPSSIPPFSSLSDMAILHNSVSNYSNFDKGRGDSLDSLPSPSVMLKPRSVMKFALQSRMYDGRKYPKQWESLCDDPTVEESIECVFEHQLEDGLEMNVDEDDDSCMENDSTYSGFSYTSGRLVQVGSFSPFQKNRFDNVAFLYDSRPSRTNVTQGVKCASFSCETCRDGKQPYIGLSPKEWPQAPILLRPTPGSGTKVIGVRYADTNEYLKRWWEEVPGCNRSKLSQTFCSECHCLPINNGNEPFGRTLVVDFESDLFQGTLQMRIRHTQGTTREPYNDSIGYFSGLNRHYQCVIQGRFKREGIPMIRCVTGQTFSDPLNLPPAYVVKGGIRIMNFFAPRLQVKLDGSSPYFVSPLGSTPQTIKVDQLDSMNRFKQFKANFSISLDQEEPVDQSKMLVPLRVGSGSSSVVRAKGRKKAFDKMCTDEDESLTFQMDKVYSFEFLQHLVDFQNFELSLGSVLGKMDLSKAVNGQPLSLMAAYQRLMEGEKQFCFDTLWSFDVWHENVYTTMFKKG